MGYNEKAGIVYNQPKTAEERVKIAHACKSGLQLELPFVLDNIENTAAALYAAWPERIYVIAKDGKIHFRGDMGPAGFKPLVAETSLKELLATN